jgi:L-ascorbate metabolism protein UlaG (beta-lactamase superfamily)
VLASARLRYVGHATVLLEIDGARLLTDPLLRPRVGHLRRIVAADASDLRGLDAVLISHAHHDHLDLPSLERLGRDLHVVLPRGLGEKLRRRGFGRLTEVDVGEDVQIGALSLRATTASHDGRRLPFGARTPTLGYVIRGSRTVYFAGDTDVFAGMSDLAGDLDLALLPVAGWGPRVGAGHLDARRAAEALRLLRPRRAVPIHWGTYRGVGLGRRGAAGDPAGDFAREAAILAPEVEVTVLAPGGEMAF